jgi:hypothetical protein
MQRWRVFFAGSIPFLIQKKSDVDVTVPFWTKDDHGFLVRKEFHMDQNDAVKLFQRRLPQFILHHVTKVNQAALYRLHRERQEDSELLLHFDFSENYNFSAQDQIQSAYYGKRMVSLFTIVIYRKEVGTTSTILCCDDLDQTKRSLISYFVQLFDDFVKPSGVKHFRLWSDGPSGQFKNHFMFAFLKFLRDQCALSFLQWNFIATSHDKGAVIGVRGSAKRTIWQKVKARQENVENAADFVRVLNSTNSDIKVKYIANLEES